MQRDRQRWDAISAWRALRSCVGPTMLSLLLVVAATSAALAADGGARTALKVCADPYNLPMSSRDDGGYENRIAELFGRELGLPVEYTWFPQRMGFIRNTLTDNNTPDGEYKCDLVMGVIENFELAAPTRPYLHSTWAMVYIKGRGLDFIQSQEDLAHLTAEQKALLRIGIWDKGPATDLVYQNDLMEQATPYQSMGGDAKIGPGQIIENDLVEDKINLTFVWGPIAGYHAKRITDHELRVIPLKSEPGLRFNFQIAMGVRHADKAWREQIDQLIATHQAEIDAILDEFGVPRLKLLVRERGGDDDDD
jgi:quinoprotein dehydrogenase-associated probable ABC transporter substrate-binding protein